MHGGPGYPVDMTDNTPDPQVPGDGRSEQDEPARDPNVERDSGETPLDEEVRDWDIDITQSDGPVLEEGDDLDTGAGLHRPRP